MTELQAFHITTCPLQGRHLIEASAGTGKTYTLVNLYLRQLFERQLLPAQILVVTFTEAATQELTQRLRNALRSFEHWLRGTLPADVSPEQQQVYQHIQHQAAQSWIANASPEHIKAALLQHSQRVAQNFDTAPVSTIHSYCQRILQNHALYSRQDFHFRLEKDATPQQLQAVADYWRHTFYTETPDPMLPMLLHTLLAKKVSPESLVKTFQDLFEDPHLRCIPDPERPDLSAHTRVLEQALEEACECWQQEHTQVLACLREAIQQGHLNKAQYKPALLQSHTDALETLFSAQLRPEQRLQSVLSWTSETALKPLLFFGHTKIHKATTKKAPKLAETLAETQAFFALAQNLCDALQAFAEAQDNALFAFYQELIQHVRTTLRQEKSRSQVLNFQDLLIHLAEALAPGAEGDTLAHLLHQEMPVALIDEFQDTDHWQYHIFNRIYARGDLFLIGDPKQSIYRFRGADLQVYLQARAEIPATQCWTLKTNYRSHPAYIQAMNTFFTHASLNPRPFGDTNIEYIEVQSGKAIAQEPTQAPAQTESQPEPALYFWYAEVPEGKKSHEAYDFNRQLLQAVAEGVGQELARGTPAEDIAILVDKHKNAKALGLVLQQRQIPHLIHGKQNVLQSREAEDMQLFLEAILKPREALSTLFSAHALGYTAAEIAAAQADEEDWVHKLTTCQHLQQRWQKYGFFAMWSRFIQDFDIYTRSLQLQHGERALTNFRHLSHLIQTAAQQQNLSPEHTLLWLQRQRQAPSEAQDEQLLHLESEHKAVQILTMHHSKGLEFPVVFCPYLWVNKNTKMEPPYKVTLADGETVLELRSAQQEHKDLAKAQDLAEQLRLSYVALTRAGQRCHVYWGWVAKHSQSPLQHYLQAKDTALHTLQVLADSPSIQVAPFPETRQGNKPARKYVSAQAPAPVKPPKLTLHTRPLLRESFQLTSFTRLSAQHEDGETEAPLLTTEPTLDAFQQQPLLAFPRGSESGLFLHSVLEALDFSQPVASQSQRVQRQLLHYGIDAHWLNPLLLGLEAVRNTPLGPPQSPPLALNSLAPQDCQKEWEFHLHLPGFQRSDLKAIYAAYQSPFTQPPSSPLPGSYLTGSIDLLFHHGGKYFIVDYKSNDLGPQLSAYTPEALHHTMQQHQYFLQFTLYTLALHQYLSQVLPDYDYNTHFGGVYYLFLRGMHPEHPGSGIYYQRPDATLATLIKTLHPQWRQS